MWLQTPPKPHLSIVPLGENPELLCVHSLLFVLYGFEHKRLVPWTRYQHLAINTDLNVHARLGMRYVVCDVIIGVVDSREDDVIRVYISSRHSFYHNHIISHAS